MRIFIWLFYLLLILLGVTFAALNAGTVQVNFYVKTVSIPIAVLMTTMSDYCWVFYWCSYDIGA